jgi:O-antigen/teichoic acid export membrane protein
MRRVSVSAGASRYGVLLGNIGARIAALVSLTIATLLVARNGGPAVVGVYALLRVLPSLLGVVISCGLPGAAAYFLAGPYRGDRRLPFTLLGIALVGGGAGAAIWVGAAPLLGAFLFRDLPLSLILLAGAAVFTRVVVATAKSCSQGSDDLPGANRVIFTEEFMFLPAFGLLWAAGLRGYTLVVAGLLLADTGTSLLAWSRLIKRGFFRDARPPALFLARRVVVYGLRAQIGGVITLMNLRLDFILLTVLTGPAVLGVYAVASKFAELVKIFGMSLTYVLYPRFAKDGPVTAAARARKLMPKALVVTAVGVAPLWLIAGFVIPAIYGSQFKPAILPAQIILLGLALDGLGGVVTGYLYGIGRPGLNSCAMAVGLGATVLLDLLLIPRYGALGAAIASAVAYTAATLTLVSFFWWVGRPASAAGKGEPVLGGRPAGAETR